MSEISVSKKVEVIATKLKVSASIRYWEDGEINGVEDGAGLMPMRNGVNWEPVIDVVTGRIDGWPSGTAANIHYKVCDAGTYTLVSDAGEIIASVDGYVPSILSPKENGYGDYIILSIDGDGVIDGWSFEYDPDFWESDE